MNIPKRVTTKVGDVFKITSDEHGLWYLQLVAIDPANMDSDTIVVFETKQKIDMNLEDIVKLPYKFYSHTTMKLGVKAGLWEKVGSAGIHVDISELVFKYYREQEIVDSLIDAAEKSNDPSLRPKYNSPYWSVWSLGDQKFHSISGDEGSSLKAEPGGIYPPKWVIQRLQTGRPFLE